MFGDLDLLETRFAPAVAYPLGERTIARRAGDVRFRGEKRVRVARFVGRRESEEATFDRSLSR